MLRKSGANKRALKTSAAEFLPARRTLKALRSAAEHCQGCPLFRDATQTVFGEGPATSRLMIVGETPGDREDLEGRPFVGPAGRLLDDALEAAGVERSQVYITNAVKHFKYTLSGSRRLHKKPTAREEGACRPWLHAELELIRPEAILCLGATAAQAFLGRAFRITQHRGEVLGNDSCEQIISTFHPSAVMRIPDSTERARMRKALFHDVKLALEKSRRR
ncbi:MAG: uracil-DNA glycosylase [Pirellula sp.]|nr:uracil-DNA glycosylase [Pirellula sp.]